MGRGSKDLLKPTWNIYLSIFMTKKSFKYQTVWFTAYAHNVLQPYKGVKLK